MSLSRQPTLGAVPEIILYCNHVFANSLPVAPLCHWIPWQCLPADKLVECRNSDSCKVATLPCLQHKCRANKNVSFFAWAGPCYVTRRRGRHIYEPRRCYSGQIAFLCRKISIKVVHMEQRSKQPRKTIWSVNTWHFSYCCTEWPQEAEPR
jgi:hypothetical protein